MASIQDSETYKLLCGDMDLALLDVMLEMEDIGFEEEDRALVILLLRMAFVVGYDFAVDAMNEHLVGRKAKLHRAESL